MINFANSYDANAAQRYKLTIAGGINPSVNPSNAAEILRKLYRQLPSIRTQSKHMNAKPTLNIN
jgi:hypothetical protein